MGARTPKQPARHLKSSKPMQGLRARQQVAMGAAEILQQTS